jgi:hypothetical protein
VRQNHRIIRVDAFEGAKLSHGETVSGKATGRPQLGGRHPRCRPRDFGLKTPRLTLKFRSDKNLSKWHPEAVASPNPGRKNVPPLFDVERFRDVIAHPILGGLHHRYAPI